MLVYLVYVGERGMGHSPGNQQSLHTHSAIGSLYARPAWRIIIIIFGPFRPKHKHARAILKRATFINEDNFLPVNRVACPRGQTSVWAIGLLCMNCIRWNATNNSDRAYLIIESCINVTMSTAMIFYKFVYIIKYLQFILQWMAMAEEQQFLSGAEQVEDASLDGKLQSKPCVQEEKLRGSREKHKMIQTKKTCGSKPPENGENSEITLLVGCKIYPKSEKDIVLLSNNILETLFKTMKIPIIPNDYPVQFHRQVYQNVCLNGLKEILETALKLLREGHQNSPVLLAFLYTLDMCCTTSAAARRALSFPGIVPLFKDFIDTYMVVFIGTPFLKTEQLFHLARSLTCVLNIVGKFMAFPEPFQSNELVTWWERIEELYWNISEEVLSNCILRESKNNNVARNGLGFVCASVVRVSGAKMLIQASGPPQPCEIVKYLTQKDYYAVFCSSLQCPKFAEKDGVLLHCARCKLAAYCSRPCQKAHWKQEHKKTCWKTTWRSNLRLIGTYCIWGSAISYI